MIVHSGSITDSSGSLALGGIKEALSASGVRSHAEKEERGALSIPCCVILRLCVGGGLI